MCSTQITAIYMPKCQKDFRVKFTAKDTIFFFRGDTEVQHDDGDPLKITYYYKQQTVSC